MTGYAPAKTGECYSDILPCSEKYLKDNSHNRLHFTQKYAQIFVLGHYLFLKAHGFSKQIMFADKYPSIFWRQIEVIVYISSH